jgi:hypothetical protein
MLVSLQGRTVKNLSLMTGNCIKLTSRVRSAGVLDRVRLWRQSRLGVGFVWKLHTGSWGLEVWNWTQTVTCGLWCGSWCSGVSSTLADAHSLQAAHFAASLLLLPPLKALASMGYRNGVAIHMSVLHKAGTWVADGDRPRACRRRKKSPCTGTQAISWSDAWFGCTPCTC